MCPIGCKDILSFPATLPARNIWTVLDKQEVRRRIEELKRPRHQSNLKKPLFHYDENEPLLLMRKFSDSRA